MPADKSDADRLVAANDRVASYGRGVATVSEVRARVASRFERLGLASWPDPHPDMASPLEQEYSRVTDPERYRVVHVRARLWAAVLEEELGAQVQTLAPSRVADGGRGFDRGLRLTPRPPGALPLLLLERDVRTQPGDALLAVLDIGVARPEVVLDSKPDCGCDACDSGSGDLLEAIDATIGHVIGGPFVFLRGRRWQAQWHPDGGSASSQGHGPDFDTVMDLCRRLGNGEAVRLPKHTEAFVGRTWFT